MPTICVDFLSFNIIGIGYDIEICMFCGDTNHGRDFLSFNIIGIGYDIEICMFCGDTNHGRELNNNSARW
jgi:hypothetical protein